MNEPDIDVDVGALKRHVSSPVRSAEVFTRGRRSG